jgi:hypothetical protein
MFRKESDFEEFQRVMVETHLRQQIRILSCHILVIALAGGTAGELDGSRQRSFDHEGIRPSAGEHRKRAYGEEKWVRETVRDLARKRCQEPFVRSTPWAVPANGS